jgi:heme-degrading monooxygenase HmoA
MKTLSLFVLVAIVFAAGCWIGNSASVHAQGKGMVYELRTYTANEGKFDAVVARFRNHTLKLFEKHGMKNIGYWIPQEAPQSQNTLIYIVAHPSRDAAKKAWDAFRNDPEWKKVQQATEANGKIVAKIDSVFMVPTDYSPLK